MRTAWLDLETRKVRLPEPYYPNERPNQRPVTLRWQVFMAGIALSEDVIYVYEGNETKVLEDLRRFLIENDVGLIVYSATRQFDEMILRGRFINARRELLKKPGPWPRLSNAGEVEWLCLKAEPNPDPEGSKNAPVWFDSGDPGLRDRVRRHCRDDVVRLMKRSPQFGH